MEDEGGERGLLAESFSIRGFDEWSISLMEKFELSGNTKLLV